MKLFWTRLARDDRRTIREYITAENPSAALKLDELFPKKTTQLLGHPSIGRPERIEGTRE